jgi:hypothetical protein
MHIYDTIHMLIDRSSVHDAAIAALMHDAVTGQQAGFNSAEEYRKSEAAKAEAAKPTDPGAEDAILAKAAEIQKQRDAQKVALADQQAQIAARESVARPATPVAVADTPASPTAAPDSPPF